MYFVEPLIAGSCPRGPPPRHWSLKPGHPGEKADFSHVGNMPNIHGNLEGFHFLYMFNRDLHEIKMKGHVRSTFFEGEKRGSCLQVKFWEFLFFFS